jgi:hypothetical protein
MACFGRRRVVRSWRGSLAASPIDASLRHTRLYGRTQERSYKKLAAIAARQTSAAFAAFKIKNKKQQALGVLFTA